MLVAGRSFSGNTAAMERVPAVTVNSLFAATLWTGNGAARSITTGVDVTGEGAVFIKARNLAVDWAVFDTVRGVTKFLNTSNTNAQGIDATSLTAFNSTGFSLGTDTTNSYVNSNTRLYVGHSFKTAANFFDVVGYTGNGASSRLIPHELGQVPGMVIVKSNSAAAWLIWHNGLSAGNYILLTASAQTTSIANTVFGNGTVTVNPDASNVTIGSAAAINANGTNYVMYVFGHDVATDGKIQCGSYTGNGSSSGPTVTLGWEPQFVMIKGRTTLTDWVMIDQTRGFSSGSEQQLLWNTTAAETTVEIATPSATGFQLNSNQQPYNQNGNVYLYMAIRKAGT